MIPMIYKLLYLTLQKLFSVPYYIADLLSPTFYLRSYRLKVIDFKKSTSPHLAIFVIYQKNGLTFSIRNMVEALIANHVKVVMVVNGEVASEIKDYLASNCHRIIYRKNTGRDFGAYQDALSTESPDRFQKVFLINDSVFYFKKNLKELIGDTLKSQHDWVALYDNYNVGYHAQSFFLCFGHELLRSKAFKTFWRKYRPFNLRHHVINAGELELSRLLIDAGYHCHVMADGSALRERLQSLGASELAHLKNFLTVAFLRRHPEIMGKEGKSFIQHLVFACETYPPSMHGTYPMFGLLKGVAVFKRDLVAREMTSASEFLQLVQAMELDPSEIKDAVAEFSLHAISRPRTLPDKIKFLFHLT